MGSLSTSTVNRSLLIPHRSYETTTEKEEMNDDGGTLGLGLLGIVFFY